MDRPLRRTRRPWLLMTMTIAIAVVACLVPVAAVGTWVLLTDPDVAAEVASSGDLWPLARYIAEKLGNAVATVMAYL